MPSVAPTIAPMLPTKPRTKFSQYSFFLLIKSVANNICSAFATCLASAGDISFLEFFVIYTVYNGVFYTHTYKA